MGELEARRRRRRQLVVTRPGLVVPVPRDPSGRAGPTKRTASGPRWRRTSRGMYVPAGVDGARVEQRIVEAACLVPAFGGVTGWAALRWAGGQWFSGVDADGCPLDVVLATGCADVRPQRGVAISAESLGPDDLTELDGVPMTALGRAVLFEMRYAASVAAAVGVADMAAYDDLVSLDELRHLVAGHLPQTGIIQAREALALAVENAWSPMETETRLLWTRIGSRCRCATCRSSARVVVTSARPTCWMCKRVWPWSSTVRCTSSLAAAASTGIGRRRSAMSVSSSWRSSARTSPIGRVWRSA